ncbi:MAG: SH3 domain-containing protein, partial [Anaerolineae bacterium]|nr:SH3 domain-containing protein [Anaerolineae bacterium]
MIFRLISILLVFALSVSGAAAESGTNFCAAPSLAAYHPLAQAETCITPDAISSASEACVGIAAGQACLGAGEVDGGGLIAVGTVADLTNVESLTSTAGSLTVLAMQADLPADETPLRLVLFGEATLTDAYGGVQPPFPTVTVKNGPVNILNLRATPDENAEVVGTMGWSEELVADGRSSDSAWFRVQDGDQIAWVFASLVTVAEGDDASTLVALDSPITQPLQSLTLDSAAGTCGGLLVQADSDNLAHLEVNGALLTFSRAALLLRGAADELSLQVISGSAEVQVAGENVLAETGSQVSIAAGAAPEVVERYPFSTLTSAPLDLLPPESLTCVAGVLADSAPLYGTPGGDASGELTSDGNATITGQFTADDGTVWWLVDNAAWVSSADVQTAGVCEAVPEVTASAAQQQVSQPVTSSQSSGFVHDQLPEGRSIWIANTGPDNL